MKLVELTLLILELNRIIDRDEHRGVTIDEVHAHIVQGDLFPWLKSRWNDMDLSLQQQGGAQQIVEGLQRLHGAYAGDELRRWGVQNNGVCLLLAWVNELIQQEGREGAAF